MNRRVRVRSLLLLLVLPLAGCLNSKLMPPVTDAASAAGGTVLVGQVRLEPPLVEAEQHFTRNVIGAGRMVNSVYLLTSPQALEREPVQPAWSELANAIEAKLGETFLRKAPPGAFNITGGMIALEMSNNGADYAFLPGRLQVPAKAGDKAVYVGTLVFHRNDFFEITRVEIRDEFAAAERAYRQQVPGGPALRKALLKKVPR